MNTTLDFVEQPVLEEEYARYVEAMRKVNRIFGITTKHEVKGECYESGT